VEPIAQSLAKHPELRLEGLMTIPAPSVAKTEAQTRDSFARLRKLEQTCRPFTHGMLSMGMTDDFELAIAEGATQIRIGTAIFGKRS
jgi:PLP dependent protein